MFSKENSVYIIDNQKYMTIFKACVRTQRSDGLFSVLIRGSHNRGTRYINIGKTIDKSKIR